MAFNNPVTFVDSMGLQPTAMENIKLQDEIVMILVLVLLGLGAERCWAVGAGAAGGYGGGVLFGASRFSAYQSRQPQAAASAAQQQEEQFARNISGGGDRGGAGEWAESRRNGAVGEFVYARRHAEEGITFTSVSVRGLCVATWGLWTVQRRRSHT